MLSKALRLTVILLATAMAPTTEAASITGTELLEYGIYNIKKGDRIEEPAAVSGYRRPAKKIWLAESTDSFPANIGTAFGAVFLINGEPKGEVVEVTVVHRFPELGLKSPATGELVKSEEYSVKTKIGGKFIHAYRISQPWEAIPGKWSLELKFGNKTIAKKNFFLQQPNQFQ